MNKFWKKVLKYTFISFVIFMAMAFVGATIELLFGEAAWAIIRLLAYCLFASWLWVVLFDNSDSHSKKGD